MNAGGLVMMGQNLGSFFCIVEINEIVTSNFYRTSEEQEWTATELKNSLRSIEWDLEDLEDTIQVEPAVKGRPGRLHRLTLDCREKSHQVPN